MGVRLRKSSPRDLFFEDVQLPKWAHGIDVLPISILQNLGFRFSHWFFRFTVCVGRIRRSPTYAIRNHCEPLLEIIHRRRKEILNLIPLRSTIKESPKEVLHQWTITLEKVLELSAGKKSCSWYADAHPSDPMWPGWPEYVKKLEARGYVIRKKDQAVDRAFNRLDSLIAAVRQGINRNPPPL